jgi:transcriptional regulator with PAS, ATPase and Fis domain
LGHLLNTAAPVALVAEETGRAEPVREHLAQTLKLAAPVFPLASAIERLGTERPGLLLVVAGPTTDPEAVRRLVRFVSIQKWPLLFLLLNDHGRNELWSELGPHVSRRLAWPEEAAELTRAIQDRLGKFRETRGAGGEDLEEVLRRRLLTQTPSLLPLVERVALAARHDVTVLLTGETGTGKTFLARLIHDFSPRSAYRFLTVPCGALSANLVESEFFGHVKGAFTGADRPKVGKFEAVGEGTLLLDEIDTLGLEQQAGLLRVIETGEFEPVGSIETQRCHARLIVASNVDLEQAAARGNFRIDLYFRLNVMSFHLPPLRERVQDIAPLARAMAARFNEKFGKDLYDIRPDAILALESFSWPGNLRQLENVMQQAVLMSNGPELLLHHLPEAIRQQANPLANLEGRAGKVLEYNRELIERNIIQRALVNHGYSRSRAADSLGISRVTLYKKMKKYGLMTLQSEEDDA